MSASRILALIILAALTTLSAFGQAQETATEQEASDSEIAALQFRSYELGWARYRNVDSAGNPKLAADPGATFPFIRVNNGYTRLRMSDLESADAIAALIARHEIAYDEDAIAGHCDPNKLAPHSSDIFCVPGTSGMEAGQIFLVLFDPETHEIAALTTTIDNKAGGAQRPTPVPAATPEAPQAAISNTNGCGPYAPGQWIPVEQHDPALDIPISGAHAGTTVYLCQVPVAGTPYLQAHPPAAGGAAGRSGSGGGSNGGGSGTSGGGQGASLNGVSGAGGGGGGGWDSGSDTGGDGTTEIIFIPDEPEECTNPFGCDEIAIKE